MMMKFAKGKKSFKPKRNVLMMVLFPREKNKQTNQQKQNEQMKNKNKQTCKQTSIQMDSRRGKHRFGTDVKLSLESNHRTLTLPLS